MVDCSDFLDEYSGFRDGSLGPARLREHEIHLAACRSCARYDRVISSGVEVFRDLPELEPSDDFMPRLQHRIYQQDYEASRRGRRASGASAVLVGGIALAIGATAWAPVVTRKPVAVLELPPVAAHAPHRVEALQVLFRTGPLLTGTASSNPARQQLLRDYSPLGSFASTPLRAP